MLVGFFMVAFLLRAVLRRPLPKAMICVGLYRIKQSGKWTLPKNTEGITKLLSTLQTQINSLWAAIQEKIGRGAYARRLSYKIRKLWFHSQPS